MEELDSSSNSHVSFLSLLMAPDDDNSTPPDHLIYHNTPHFIHNNNHHPLPFPPSSASFDVTNNISYDQQFPTTFSDYHHNVDNYNYSSPFDDSTNNTLFLPPLPELLSLENTTPQPPLLPPLPPQQRPEQKDDFTLNSIVANFQSSSLKNKHPQPQQRSKKKNRPPRSRQSKISEKVYNLGKLLPGGHRHRKSTADMLEEAHKYIKFLQAQVSVLNSMPTHDSSSLLLPATTTTGGGSGSGRGSGSGSKSDENGKSRALAILAMLSRQQLLQVVLNSPAAQVIMADNEWCLFSAEQVASIKRAQARQKIIQQLLSNLPL